MRSSSSGQFLRVGCLAIVTLLSVTMAMAQPAPEQLAPEPAEQAATAVEAAAAGGINERLDALADETGQLRAEIAAQSDILRRLVPGSSGLLPVSSQPELDAPATDSDQLTTCRGDIAKLSARLQQQQLVLDEAQRRAEKAEKAAAAMNEAQAHAATEIERLSTELAMAKARQSEALQQAVELERRLATAEARLARATANTQDPPAGVGAGAGADSAPFEPAVALISEGAEAEVAAEDSRVRPAAGLGIGQSNQAPRVQASAPVFYEVRAADTLSRISARVYGDAGAWERIYEANRDLLTTPDALAPGMSLVIP
jgi:nucleoid-associated protein YgaU